VWVQPKEQKIVGAALAAARGHAGLTQSDLARRLRKSQSLFRVMNVGKGALTCSNWFALRRR
jgi:hypothetical protein